MTDGDIIVWNPLIKGLVKNYASKYGIVTPWDREDMMQVAYLSLVETSRKYILNRPLVLLSVTNGLKNWRSRSYYRHRHLAYADSLGDPRAGLVDPSAPSRDLDRLIWARELARRMTFGQLQAFLGEGSSSRQARMASRNRARKALKNVGVL